MHKSPPSHHTLGHNHSPNASNNSHSYILHNPQSLSLSINTYLLAQQSLPRWPHDENLPWTMPEQTTPSMTCSWRVSSSHPLESGFPNHIWFWRPTRVSSFMSTSTLLTGHHPRSIPPPMLSRPFGQVHVLHFVGFGIVKNGSRPQRRFDKHKGQNQKT